MRLPRVDGPAGLDIESRSSSTARSSPSALPTMYWSPAQMLAHLTVERRQPAHRRPVRIGHDLRSRAATSAARCSSSAGAARSRSPAPERTFLEDGDEVMLRYTAPGTAGGRLPLGEVTGRIVPARAVSVVLGPRILHPAILQVRLT